MSDAMTDIERDRMRARAIGEWIDALLYYLKSPTDQSLDKVRECAEAVEKVPRGYDGSQLKGFAEHSLELAPRLRAKDTDSWKGFMERIGLKDRGRFRDVMP